MAEKNKQAPKEEAPKKITFKVGGKEYRFKIPRYINNLGNKVTAEEAVKSPAELERLVAIQSGVIEEV